MIEKKVDELLSELSLKHGFELLRDLNFDGTGRRVVKAYEELLAGYGMDAKDILKTDFPAGDYDQMIICKDIDFYSICSHHMLPFFGKVAVGYIPGQVKTIIEQPECYAGSENIAPPGLPYQEGGKVVGLSKLARIVQMFARRFQIQERMTQQIAKTLEEHLRPSGVGVVVYDVKHLCMLMRGVKQHTSTMDTSCLLGEFRSDPAVRQEFFSMIGK